MGAARGLMMQLQRHNRRIGCGKAYPLDGIMAETADLVDLEDLDLARCAFRVSEESQLARELRNGERGVFTFTMAGTVAST